LKNDSSGVPGVSAYGTKLAIGLAVDFRFVVTPSRVKMSRPASFCVMARSPHTLSTILNPRDASGRLSPLMAASSPGAVIVSSHPTFRLTTCTLNPAAGRSTVERLTFRAVTRTLSFDQTWQSSTMSGVSADGTNLAI
jgi:hypothetical protein